MAVEEAIRYVLKWLSPPGSQSQCHCSGSGVEMVSGRRDYAKANGVPIPADLDSPYSVDQNLWGRALSAESWKILLE